MISYKVIRSGRKTLSIEIRPDGSVLARSPYSVRDQEIASFIRQKEEWIGRKQAELLRRRSETGDIPVLTFREIQDLADRALQVIPDRVAYYAPKVGVTYGRITIRNQRTRWGSCSAKGNLNFNCLLMLAPPQVLDSVVVHELCHRKEMNHSQRFYQEVYRVFPEYDYWHGWLKEHGNELMARMP